MAEKKKGFDLLKAGSRLSTSTSGTSFPMSGTFTS